ncbi:MAG: family 16 glycosylhydrolase [Bacteroidota bacterium]
MKNPLKFYFLIIIPIMLSCSSQPDEVMWELVWADEFDGTGRPDSTKWNYDMGDGCPAVCGWGNNELQYYTDDTLNARLENGNLVIEARQEARGEKPYTSTRLVSRGKAEWLYGRFEIRAQLPTGKGTWPAIWMLPSENKYGTWPKSGEIDIMEHVGYDPGVVHGTLHSEKYNHLKQTQKEGITRPGADIQKNFHVYSIDWEPNQVTFMVDDSTYHRVDRVEGDDFAGWPFDRKFYMILNQAVGGNWGGKEGVDPGIWPQRLLVDYVRVYQHPGPQQ